MTIRLNQWVGLNSVLKCYVPSDLSLSAPLQFLLLLFLQTTTQNSPSSMVAQAREPINISFFSR